MAERENPLLRSRQSTIKDLLKLAQGGHLYAIVDSSRVPEAAKKAMEAGEQRAVSLYRETPEQEFWDIAPYLFKLDQALLDWITKVSEVIGWGILVATRADLPSLRHHFRHFLKVQEPGGDIWLFRFYDPRVLKHFLVACNEEELRMFYGPAVALGVSISSLADIEFLSQSTAQSRLPQPNYAFLLRLREEHLESLAEQADRALAAEILGFLRSRFPDLVQESPSNAVEERILLGLRKARNYGFTRNATFAAFVGIMFEIGPRFDEQPAIHAALTDQSVTADDRWNLMMANTSDQDWDSAEVLSSPTSWEELAQEVS